MSSQLQQQSLSGGGAGGLSAAGSSSNSSIVGGVSNATSGGGAGGGGGGGGGGPGSIISTTTSTAAASMQRAMQNVSRKGKRVSSWDFSGGDRRVRKENWDRRCSKCVCDRKEVYWWFLGGTVEEGISRSASAW